MATGTFSVTGVVNGLPFGSQSIGALTVSSTAAAGVSTDLVLASGDNTITIPAAINVTAALIVFGAGSGTVKKLKGVGGDTGITLNPTSFNLITFVNPAPANFVINSSAVDTGITTYIYFL